MPCYKDEKTGTWYCQFRYADFTGKRKQKRKRGFKTKREAQEWEREFHLQKAKSCDMTLASFVELYFNDREHHVRGTTIFAFMTCDTVMFPSALSWATPSFW